MSVGVLKRAFDFVVSTACLVLLSPLFLVVSFVIFLDVGRPVLFVQRRPGLHGRPFRLIKFRTMRNVCDSRGVPLSDEDRLTRVGAFLRKWSIDELPELWNVVVGDMSIVGPRPLLMEYLPLYSSKQARRHEMKPGLTGLAQVNGRNNLTWEEKFDLDVYYIDHWSLTLDLLILVRTVRQVLTADGVSARGHATMPPFTGTTKRAENL